MSRQHRAPLVLLVALGLVALCAAQDPVYGPVLVQPPTATGDIGFSSSVALSPTGSKLAVGSPFDSPDGKSASGTVGVYTRDGNGWELQQALTHSDAPADANMGVSIALTDDKLIAGAPAENGNQGAIYFFTFDGDWKQDGKVLGIDNTEDGFGISLATDGVILLVGAQGRNSFQGVVIVFTLSGTPLKWAASVTLSTGAVSAALGSSLSLNSNIILAGAPEENAYQGCAYAWSRADLGNPAGKQQQITTTSTLDSGDFFGTAVAVISDKFVAVSTNEDVVYLFTFGSDNSWKQSGVLAVPAGTDFFGASMSSNSLYLIVGSAGKAFLYAVSGLTIADEPKELTTEATQTEGFGRSVAIAGNYIVVADNYFERSTESSTAEDPEPAPIADSKSVHTFAFPEKPSFVQPVNVGKTSKSQGVGHQVGFIGDLALVSVPFCVTPQTDGSCDGGYSLAYKHEPDQWKFHTKIRNPFRNRDNQFGRTMEVSGNYILVAAPNSNYVDKDIGIIVLYRLNSAKLEFERDSIVRYRKMEDKHELGSSISLLDPVLAVGMPEHDVVKLDSTKLLNTGAAHIFRRVPTKRVPWAQRKTIYTPTPTANEHFGQSVSLLDGTTLAVSNNPTLASDQAVYIFIFEDEDWKYAQKILNDGLAGFGWKIAFFGDKLLYIAAYKSEGDAGSISAYQYNPSSKLYDSPILIQPRIKVPGERFGYSFATDGVKLVVGARPCDDASAATCNVKGAVYTFSKDSTDNWAQQSRFTSDVDNGSDGYGNDVAVNGETILVSAPLKVVNDRNGEAYFIRK